MRPSLRFLGLVVIGWAGVRAATLGVLPGAALFKIEPARAKAPAIVATEFAPIAPIAPAPLQADSNAQYAPVAYAPPAVRPVMVPAYYAAPVSPPAPARSSSSLPPARAAFDASSFDEWPLVRFTAASLPQRSSVPVPPQTPAAPVPPIDERTLKRFQLSSWALLRSQQTGVAGSQSLASAGQLGASQAGLRLMYNFNRQIALTARMSSEVGRRGGEVAAGVRIRPLVDIPVWLTAERRERIGRYGGGRNDFALFLEGGLYQQPLPWRFLLDTYLQAGVVGTKSRDLFVDGGLTATRPLFKQFSAGLGVWGAAQPGLARLDAGPRLTMLVKGRFKVHIDWRQKLAGNARPGSGPALTLAGDF